MPTDELKQALLRQKAGETEKDFIGVIAKTFDVDYGLVARILCALDHISNERLDRHGDDLLRWQPALANEDLVMAIHKTIEREARRIIVARAIAAGRSFSLTLREILPREHVADACRGCPMSLECAAEQLSTPQNCWDGNGPLGVLVVFPLQLFDDHVEVEAQQPHGKHLIPLSRINIRR